MAYYDVAKLVDDADFSSRVAACYALETREVENAQNPYAWAREHIWEVAAQPSFGDAYNYAVNTGNAAPGRDPSVITDNMILAAVNSIRA